MKHFDIWQWADYVRGIGGRPVRLEMKAHLASGCERCRRTVEILHQVVVATRAEAQYEPPDEAVRYANALYARIRPEQISLPEFIARLVYDSDREPLPAGIRAARRLARRAVFTGLGYQLDLQLEGQPDTGLVTLVGQLADPRQPTTATADVPVLLMLEESVIASTVCNEFGEFQFEYEPRGDLRLQIPLQPVGRRLVIPLDRLSPAVGAKKLISPDPSSRA